MVPTSKGGPLLDFAKIHIFNPKSSKNRTSLSFWAPDVQMDTFLIKIFKGTVTVDPLSSRRSNGYFLNQNL